MVQRLKDGFNEVAEGMLLECRNRDDALEDLKTGVEVVGNRRRVSVRTVLTQSQEVARSKPSEIAQSHAKLADAINAVIRECGKATTKSQDRYEAVSEDAQQGCRREAALLGLALKKTEECHRKDERLLQISRKLLDANMWTIYQKVLNLSSERQDEPNQGIEEIKSEIKRSDERFDRLRNRAWDDHLDEVKARRQRVAALKQIAADTGIELEI